MTSLEGTPPGLFRDALEAGQEIEIIFAFEMFPFLGSFEDGPKTARVALALETVENADKEISRRHPLVLNEEMLVKLISASQAVLQLIQRHAPGGDEDEPR